MQTLHIHFQKLGWTRYFYLVLDNLDMPGRKVSEDS